MKLSRPSLPLQSGLRPGCRTTQSLVKCNKHPAEKVAGTPRQKRIADRQKRWQQEQAEKKKLDSGLQASTSSPESSSSRINVRSPAKRPPTAVPKAADPPPAQPPSAPQPSFSHQHPPMTLVPQPTRSSRLYMDRGLEWSLWTQPKHGGSAMTQLHSMSNAMLSQLSKTWAEDWVQMEQLGRTTLSQTALQNVDTLASCVRERLQAAGSSGSSSIHDAGIHSPAFDQQDLADLAWSLRHFNHSAVHELEQAMQVPFTVLPNKLPHLDLDQLLTEIELQQDEIQLVDRRILESRQTAWQSDIGATFCYSGKEMMPAGQHMTPQVAKVRDQLVSITGEFFDSVLINYYEDGRCGIRFHVDPLYGCWTPNTAVVSVGQTRRFTFREINDFKSRWDYSVRNGDVVFMFGDCQERLQHSIKVEREDRGAADMGPRMSLVFKQRIKDEQALGGTTGSEKACLDA